ncbi:prenyltransferase [Paraflavitalea soli]|uniref:Prenyltransferase n=1 Tax=Paraflavitalea soli TaxID=2315862 RepID=A0A3B7MWB4_9BACT|nr:UbiA family prenyltransferase [Paraflavitalea soli]AXY77499.1 prenyltransferase [Paraflavitalea soli]
MSSHSLLQRSTIQLLRFHFSFFLLPVYLFALGQVPAIQASHALLIFFILHVLVYPASNGYNSYMDRDEGSIGGIKNPLQPTRQLFLVSVVMDVVAMLLSLFIGYLFTACIIAYILASRAYSYRGIRLKQYPLAGYLTVIIFQGAVTFFMVYHGCSVNKTTDVPLTGMIAASLLIGGFYPLTQVYQHEADKKDGVLTISAALGYRGTFIFTAIIYSLAMGLLAYLFYSTGEFVKFLVLATCMLPILVYFFKWAGGVWKDENVADFTHTMRMNLLASVCTNIAFLILLTWKLFE